MQKNKDRRKACLMFSFDWWLCEPFFLHTVEYFSTWGAQGISEKTCKVCLVDKSEVPWVHKQHTKPFRLTENNYKRHRSLTKGVQCDPLLCLLPTGNPYIFGLKFMKSICLVLNLAYIANV